MKSNSIFREPTSDEKNDFIDLMKTDRTGEIIGIMEFKFSEKNRERLLNSNDPTKEKLSCFTCWKLEYKNAIASDKFEEAYEQYNNRLTFNRVRRLANATTLKIENAELKSAKSFDYSLKFVCPYCRGAHCIKFMFPSTDFSKEVQKILSAKLE